MAAHRALAAEPKWKKHDINAKSEFEAAGVFDVDNDGKLDIVSGDTWYQAPDWKPAPRPRRRRAGAPTTTDFATLPDGRQRRRQDRLRHLLVLRQERRLGREPGQDRASPGPTTRSTCPGTSEAAVAGRPDRRRQARRPAQPDQRRRLVRAGRRPAAKPTWKKHDFGTAAAGHGVGSGDVNGDGRVDLLTPKGWFEAPADPSTRRPGPGTPTGTSAPTGIQILARDVDGDGLSDLVYGMGHDYGLFWLKQGKGAGGERTWTKHDDRRRRSPRSTPCSGPTSTATARPTSWSPASASTPTRSSRARPTARSIAWYHFDRDAEGVDQARHLPGRAGQERPGEGRRARLALKDFPAGTAGTGLQMTAIDIDGDGDLDLRLPRQERALPVREPRRRLESCHLSPGCVQRGMPSLPHRRGLPHAMGRISGGRNRPAAGLRVGRYYGWVAPEWRRIDGPDPTGPSLVLTERPTMATAPVHLAELQALGQSVWLDNISREILNNGELKRLIDEDGLQGVTSNPTIFDKAISHSADYDDAVKTAVAGGSDADAIYQTLTVADIQEALDLFRPLYDRTKGGDGYVSLEVSP